MALFSRSYGHISYGKTSMSDLVVPEMGVILY